MGELSASPAEELGSRNGEDCTPIKACEEGDPTSATELISRLESSFGSAEKVVGALSNNGVEADTEMRGSISQRRHIKRLGERLFFKGEGGGESHRNP